MNYKEMNYKEIFNKMVEETANYLTNNNLKVMVLGISGGVDSTVTAAVCSEVVRRYPNKNFRFIGVSLPCSSNTDGENTSAELCMKGFCKAGDWWVENLQKEYMLMKSTCELHVPSTGISQGNIKARLRMIYLYNLASTLHGIVMDTDNLTEHYLGFFTIHGDVADFNPIGCLWKHNVYELAKYLYSEYYVSPYDVIDSLSYKQMALESAIGIMPTDGNGVHIFGDIGQIAPAFVNDNNIEAYTKVDEIIDTYLECSEQHSDVYQDTMSDLYKKFGYDTVNGIVDRIRKTEYKRKRLPIVPEFYFK